MNNKISATHIFLEVTRNCNYECSHCMRGTKQNLSITPRIIDKVFSEIINCNSIAIAGGEPFLAFDMISYIVDKIICSNWNIHKFQITTNGSILDSRLFDVFTKLSNNKKDCEVLLRISADKFHNKNVSQIAFDFYSALFISNNEKIRIEQTNEITMFEYAGRGIQYLETNYDSAPNIKKSLDKNHYIKFENNHLFCPIIVLSNGNITLYNRNDKEYRKMDAAAIGNIMDISVKEMIEKCNTNCVITCAECELYSAALSSLLRFQLNENKFKNEDYYSDYFYIQMVESVLSVREKAHKLYPNISALNIIRNIPTPNDFLFAPVDEMNLIYNLIQEYFGDKTIQWLENFMIYADKTLYDEYEKNKNNIRISKWIYVITIIQNLNKINKSLLNVLCKSKYIQYISGAFCPQMLFSRASTTKLCAKTLPMISFC